jgi:hypothetical protein
MTTKDGLEFAQFERKISDMITACEKTLAE